MGFRDDQRGRAVKGTKDRWMWGSEGDKRDRGAKQIKDMVMNMYDLTSSVPTYAPLSQAFCSKGRVGAWNASDRPSAVVRPEGRHQDQDAFHTPKTRAKKGRTKVKKKGKIERKKERKGRGPVPIRRHRKFSGYI